MQSSTPQITYDSHIIDLLECSVKKVIAGAQKRIEEQRETAPRTEYVIRVEPAEPESWLAHMSDEGVGRAPQRTRDPDMAMAFATPLEASKTLIRAIKFWPGHGFMICPRSA